jgi:alpha-D-xyloside xylohydrolase
MKGGAAKRRSLISLYCLSILLSLKVCVYPGADGNFVLYEDEGNNYNYENGAYTEIPMTWNDAKRTLTIDARRGCYEGMLDERKFTVRMPDGSEKTVLYKGKKINVKF